MWGRWTLNIHNIIAIYLKCSSETVFCWLFHFWTIRTTYILFCCVFWFIPFICVLNHTERILSFFAQQIFVWFCSAVVSNQNKTKNSNQTNYKHTQENEIKWMNIWTERFSVNLQFISSVFQCVSVLIKCSTDQRPKQKEITIIVSWYHRFSSEIQLKCISGWKIHWFFSFHMENNLMLCIRQ